MQNFGGQTRYIMGDVQMANDLVLLKKRARNKSRNPNSFSAMLPVSSRKWRYINSCIIIK